jgi:outer membrane immunogenic protein
MHRPALVLAAVLALAGGAATAADLPPVTAATAIPPPWPRTWDWTGFYGGINAGFSFGNARNTWNIPVGPSVSVTSTDTERFDGPLGGIQAGWNWQYSALLVGIEADIDYGAETSKQTTFNSAFTTTAPGTIAVTHSDTLNWFGTVRGRFGVALGPALVYGTGGFAWALGKEHVAGTATNTNTTVAFINSSDLTTLMAGWTAGGGAEIAFCNNWAVRAEYLYADLGTTHRGFIVAQGTLPTLTIPGAVEPSARGARTISRGSASITIRTVLISRRDDRERGASRACEIGLP